MRQAIRDTIAEEMRKDKKVFILGEEVAEYQGAYKVTQGLLDEFGEERKIEARMAIRNPGYCDRALRAESLTEINARNIDGLKIVLRDHENRPESICRHREDQTDDLVLDTLASVVMDVTSGTMDVADGPPCQFEYVTHRLSR